MEVMTVVTVSVVVAFCTGTLPCPPETVSVVVAVVVEEGVKVVVEEAGVVLEIFPDELEEFAPQAPDSVDITPFAINIHTGRLVTRS